MLLASERARRASSACRRLSRASTMAWSRYQMLRSSSAVAGSWARIARSNSLNSPPMLPISSTCWAAVLLSPTRAISDFTSASLVFPSSTRRVASDFALADDLGVLHVGFEHGMLRRELLRFAVGLLLALCLLNLLEIVEARLDNRDALAKLFELGGRQIAPRGCGRLTRRQADQLLLEKVDFRRACPTLADKGCTARFRDDLVLTTNSRGVGVLEGIERLLLGRLLLAGGSRA